MHKRNIFAALIGTLTIGLFPLSHAVAAETTKAISAQQKRDQKTWDSANRRIERAGQKLADEGQKVKDIGQKMIDEADHDLKGAESDRAKASELNDRVVHLRGEAADAQTHGDNDRVKRLNSEANDLAARSAGLITAADAWGPAREQRKALGQQIIQKADQTIAHGTQTRDLAK